MKDTAEIITEITRQFEANRGRFQPPSTRPPVEHGDLIQAAQCPARHWKATPDMDGEWGAALNQLTERLGHGALLALVGGRGSGKTQMAVELIRRNLERRKRSLFVTATSFFMAIKATYKPEAKADEQAVMWRFQQPSLLVIDEIGKRGETEWEHNLLFELLNRRYNDLKDTVLIDNRPKAEFIAAIGESLASRMNEGGGIKECNWATFRN